VPIPSTRWFWPLRASLHQMLVFNAHSWEKEYGPGGPYEGASNIMGRDPTLLCVTELSLFFLMSCVWFRQTVSKPSILQQEPGHIERHARKRIQKEHKLDEPPTVKVIMLRKAMRTPASEAPADRQEGAREYSCRWIVDGHARLQPVGPERKDRKLIWIEPYIGNAKDVDKPLKTSSEKVYAVVR
jgi:hypothetical protein